MSRITINFILASISSNVLLTILLLVRSFVRGLKLYCWDKSGLLHAFKTISAQMFSAFFSHTFIGNYRFFLPLSDSFGHNFTKIKVLLLSKLVKTFGGKT